MLGINASKASVITYAPTPEVATMVAGFNSVTARAAIITATTAEIAIVWMDEPKYCILVTITSAKQIPPTHNFSIEKPSNANNNPPAIGIRI